MPQGPDGAFPAGAVRERHLAMSLANPIGFLVSIDWRDTIEIVNFITKLHQKIVKSNYLSTVGLL